MATRLLGRAVFRQVISQCHGFPPSTRTFSSGRQYLSSKPTLFSIGAVIVGGACVTGFKLNRASAAAAIPFDLPKEKVEIIKAVDYTEETTQWKNIKYPDLPVSRKVEGPTKLEGIRLTLFQYQTCPFCCKVRAFLDFVGVPYDVVEVEPVLRQQIKFSDYKKVPILLLREKENCWQLNDSTAIISILQSYLLDKSEGIKKYLDLYQPVKTKDDSGKVISDVRNKYNIMFGGPRKDMQAIESELEWRKWADNVFVHVLSPNVYRTREEALQAFYYFSEVGEWERLFPAWERYLVIYVGATAMYFVGKRLQKKYRLKENVRLSFYDECNYWTKNLDGKKFAGGNSPNLADLAVFGVLSSIEGCSAFSDVLENTKIQRWYDDMKIATGRSR